MKLHKALLLPTLFALALQADQSAQWQQYQAQQAMHDLDCEFKDCTQKVEPKVIVKEKIVYKDRPVEKIVIKEKVVYKDRPVEQPQPQQQGVPGRNYDKLFIDISAPNDPTYIQDFIYRTNRAGGLDWNRIFKQLSDAPRDGEYRVKITGMIELPQGLNGKTLYIKPLMKDINPKLVIGGKAWKIREITLDNAYTQDRAIPFYYTYKTTGYRSKSDLINDVAKELADISVVISDQKKQRGVQREYLKARVFTVGN